MALMRLTSQGDQCVDHQQGKFLTLAITCPQGVHATEDNHLEAAQV